MQQLAFLIQQLVFQSAGYIYIYINNEGWLVLNFATIFGNIDTKPSISCMDVITENRHWQ